MRKEGKRSKREIYLNIYISFFKHQALNWGQGAVGDMSAISIIDRVSE